MSVSRYTLYNLAGATVPLVVALVAVPLYLHRIGDARYGVLTIVWLLLGYFGVFDLGLSRATANQIARLREGSTTEREEVFWNGCLLNACLGVLGGVTLYLVGGPVLGEWLRTSRVLHGEAIDALPWIAAAVPVTTVSAVLTGALEGRQRFGVVNAIQASGTILFQAVPLAAAFLIGRRLQVLVPVAVIVRALSAVPLGIAVKAALPLSMRPRIRVRRMHALLAYGLWVMVTDVISPLLLSLDRMFIGVVLGAPAVAYYAVPFSLVARTQVLAAALARTLFPYLSAENVREARNRVLDAMITIGAVVIPMVVVGMFAVGPFLALWMGRDFAARAAPVAEALLCGIWFNGLASIPFAMLQAQGRPDIVAKFHLVELPPFVGILWFGVHHFGLIGAAFAWALRVAVDAILLVWAAGIASKVVARLAPGALMVASAWVAARALEESASAEKFATAACFAVAAGAWSLYSSDRIRREVMTHLRYLKA